MEQAEEWDKSVSQDLEESCYWNKRLISYQNAESFYVLKNGSLRDQLDSLTEKFETGFDDNGRPCSDCGDKPFCDMDGISVSSVPGAMPKGQVEDIVNVQIGFAANDQGTESPAVAAHTYAKSELPKDNEDIGKEEMTQSGTDTAVKYSSPTMSKASGSGFFHLDHLRSVEIIREETQTGSDIVKVQTLPEESSGFSAPRDEAQVSVVSENSKINAENFGALEKNYNLLKWSVSCREAETVYRELETSSVLSPCQTSFGTNDNDLIVDLPSSDEEPIAVLLALGKDYFLMKVALINNIPVKLGGIEIQNDADNLERLKDLLSEQIGDVQRADVTSLTEETDDTFENLSEAERRDSLEIPAEVREGAHGLRSSRCSDLRDDASSNGSGGFVWTAQDQDEWHSWSSDASVKSFDVPLPLGGVVDVTEAHGARKQTGEYMVKEMQTEKDMIHEEAQTEILTANEEVQTENETLHRDVQTEGEIVQCCQCGVYSFLPLGEQFVIRLKEEMSQRLSLENLIRIVEKDAWNVRQELMDEREGVVRLQAEAADLKGRLTHAEHVSAELKTRNDELETSLEGARNMISRLEQQMSNTSYFNSGIDYMLEAKLSQGRAVEALAKVQVLQNELLHSQAEVNKLLEQISNLTKEKNQMVSNTVHQELLQIADERVKDAELRTLQLENEVFALKEENKQLKSLSSSTEKTASLMSSTTPYKFMFNEEIDPYKEILALKKEMLHLKTKSMAYSSYPSLDSTYGSAYSAGVDLDDPVLPEVGSFGTPADPAQRDSAADLSPEKFTGGPLIATGSDSDDSEWSDEGKDSVTSVDASRHPSEMTLTLPDTFEDLYSGLVTHAGDRLKPRPPKPRLPPKPKAVAKSSGETISHDLSSGVPFFMVSEVEEGTCFEKTPVPPELGMIKKPRGPRGRQLPTKYSSVY